MSKPLRVFVSSTSEDLRPHRDAARDIILDVGWQFVGMEHFGTGTDSIVNECRRKVDGCDLVVLIQAFRQGWVPTIAEGGDGETSITGIEFKVSTELKKPVRVFLAEMAWPGNLWEDEALARAWVTNFRNGLNRMVVFFPYEDEPLDGFRSLFRQELVKHKNELLRVFRVHP